MGRLLTQRGLEPFLLKFGFEKTDDFSYSNVYCNVVIEEQRYAIADNLGAVIYSENHDFYWLLGYLVWDGFIDKNFKK